MLYIAKMRMQTIDNLVSKETKEISNFNQRNFKLETKENVDSSNKYIFVSFTLNCALSYKCLKVLPPASRL